MKLKNLLGFTIVEIAMVTVIAGVVIFVISNALKKTKDSASTTRGSYDAESNKFLGVMGDNSNGVAFPADIPLPATNYGCPYITQFPSPVDNTTVKGFGGFIQDPCGAGQFCPARLTDPANLYLGGSSNYAWNTFPGVIQVKFNYDLGSAKIINRVLMRNRSTEIVAIQNFEVYGSNNVSDFNDQTASVTATMKLLGNFTGATQPTDNTNNINHRNDMAVPGSNNGIQLFLLTKDGLGDITQPNTTAYRYYIVKTLTVWGDTWFGVRVIAFQQGTAGGTPNQLQLTCS